MANRNTTKYLFYRRLIWILKAFLGLVLLVLEIVRRILEFQ